MSESELGSIRTDIPARLDRLPWARWHWMVIIGLGTVWILDGLEVTIVGTLSGQISKPGSGVHITQSQISGLAAALYVAGVCAGALFCGWLTDRCSTPIRAQVPESDKIAGSRTRRPRRPTPAGPR